jgi:hypothetical protein
MNRHTIRFAFVLAAVLGALALLVGPAAAAGTGKPQFYTDAFHFTFVNDDATAACGFVVNQTVNGSVQGWDRWNADGSYAGGNVGVTIDGAFFSDAASVPFRAKTRNLDVGHPDGSDTGSVRGLMLQVLVPGQGAAIDAGRMVVTFPPGGGAPTVDVVVGHTSDDAFFGSPGHPGTLCGLLAG